MEWFFEDDSTLVELQSSFKLHLVSGSWYSPEEIWPECSDSYSAYQQAKLLSCAMTFVAANVIDTGSGKVASV